MTEWQPIETAPKDGTNILLFCNYALSDGERPTEMYSNIIVGVYRGRPHDTNGWWICDMCPREDGYGGVYINPMHIEPTHWRPLPEPPK